MLQSQQLPLVRPKLHNGGLDYRGIKLESMFVLGCSGPFFEYTSFVQNNTNFQVPSGKKFVVKGTRSMPAGQLQLLSVTIGYGDDSVGLGVSKVFGVDADVPPTNPVWQLSASNYFSFAGRKNRNLTDVGSQLAGPASNMEYSPFEIPALKYPCARVIIQQNGDASFNRQCVVTLFGEIQDV